MSLILLELLEVQKSYFLLIETIKKKGATLKSIKDNWLNLSENNHHSQFLTIIIAGVNQLEKDLLKMRQKEGIEIVKINGKYKGRVKKYYAEHEGMNYAIKLYLEKTMTVKQICEITNISRAAFIED